MKYSILQQEHAALGASLTEVRGIQVANHYADKTKELQTLTNGTALIDVSWVRLMLIEGEGLDAFSDAALSCEPLAVGQARPAALLAGDGALVNIELTARCGDNELLLVDTSGRFDVVDGWLSFLEGIESGGVAPYAGIFHEEQTESLQCLQLVGKRAQELLSDYVADAAMLPKPGQVAQINLDKIACIVLGLPAAHGTSYLIFVPPAYAAVLWRSFLSFTYLEPVGFAAWDEHERAQVPWYTYTQETRPLMVPAEVLNAWGVLRTGQDFIGARGLYA